MQTRREVAMDFSRTPDWRLSRFVVRLAGSLAMLSAACATSIPPAAGDRFSPAQMKNGPSMYETGRFGTVPLSNGGLTVDQGRIDSIDPHARRGAPIGGARVSSAQRTSPGRRSPAKHKPQPRIAP
jgi:hypothetical protein